MHRWHLSGLDHRQFEYLVEMDDSDLAARGIVRCVATQDHGFPCRISLVDARVGEELLLLPYTHLACTSPYRASGPVFIRCHAVRCVLPPGVVPPYVHRRQMSVRAYDARSFMLSGQVCEGAEVAAALDQLFDDPHVHQVHLHNAGRGCFSCRAERCTTDVQPDATTPSVEITP
ncbi:DUF1203 domain-containing protein [Stenotrophomonas rhizophila]|uniref:DUF1203 domain-containing protein n=1 Tax=Stenotrophomonas rhizophila TaxID=216778 RepID=UPI0028A941E1|nr:DUF1203 domain-containing protein [Stenotrophomonas rhizophila]